MGLTTRIKPGIDFGGFYGHKANYILWMFHVPEETFLKVWLNLLVFH